MKEQEIIQRNIALMQGSEKGSFHYLLYREQTTYLPLGSKEIETDLPEVSCVFYYNPKTGEIIYFGNTQNIPNDITYRFLEGFLKSGEFSVKIVDPGKFNISADCKFKTQRKRKYRITNISGNYAAAMLGRSSAAIDERAKGVLEKTVEEFNQRDFSFEII